MGARCPQPASNATDLSGERNTLACTNASDSSCTVSCRKESRSGNGYWENYVETDLGKGEETLEERDDALHFSHCVDTVLHGLRVLGPRTFKNTLDARNVVFGPLLVRQADSLQTQSDAISTTRHSYCVFILK